MPSTGDSGAERGGEGARALLTELSEEELGQYRRVAQDQVVREERWRWLLAAVAIAGVVIGIWSVGQLWDRGFAGWAFGALGLALAMGYVPYRVSRSRKLWKAHVDAVEAERSRRAAGREGQGDGGR